MSIMVLAVAPLTDSVRPHHEKISQLPIVAGRSPACDVIVADPYLAPRQYILRANDGAQADTPWEICALDSVNPTRLNGVVLAVGQWVGVKSGDVIEAGETAITAYAPDYAVAQALPMTQDKGLWSSLGRMPVAAALFALALAMTAGWSYLEIWSSEAAMTAAMSVAAVFFIIIVWASLWSVVGRLLTHRSRFAQQLSLASVYVIVSLVTGMLLRGLDFLLSGNMAAQAATLVTQTVLLALLTSACLAAATMLTQHKRMQAALSFAVGLMISVISLSAISNMGFNPVPPFSSTLSPGLARFAPAVAAQDFIDDSAHLFDDADFRVIPADNPQE